jgi:hypothetical protein
VKARSVAMSWSGIGTASSLAARSMSTCEVQRLLTGALHFLPSVAHSVNNIEHECLSLNSHSLVTLDGDAGNRRRRCQLFIPGQPVFTREELSFIRRSGARRPRRWHRSPERRSWALLAIGIVGGMVVRDARLPARAEPRW